MKVLVCPSLSVGRILIWEFEFLVVKDFYGNQEEIPERIMVHSASCVKS